MDPTALLIQIQTCRFWLTGLHRHLKSETSILERIMMPHSKWSEIIFFQLDWTIIPIAVTHFPRLFPDHFQIPWLFEVLPHSLTRPLSISSSYISDIRRFSSRALSAACSLSSTDWPPSHELTKITTSSSVAVPTNGGPPCRGGGAYGLWGSCRFRFLGIQRGGVY